MKMPKRRLTRALPLAALTAVLVTPTLAAAQTVEGDTDITVSFNLVDQDLAANVAVVSTPDFGDITKPRALGGGVSQEECRYELRSDGSNEATGFIVDGVGLTTNSQQIGCEFLGSFIPPSVSVLCPAGQRAIVTGAAEANGISARITVASLASSDGLIDCKDGTGETFSIVQVNVSRDSVFGAQQITIPLEVMFE